MPKQDPRKLFIILVVALVSGVAGFVFIRAIRGFSGLQTQLSESEQIGEQEDGNATQKDMDNGWSSYKGIIQIARDAPSRATHFLADENGEPIIYLMADDQKLVISEALQVEVQGTMENLKDATKPVMNVERVVFK